MGADDYQVCGLPRDFGDHARLVVGVGELGDGYGGVGGRDGFDGVEEPGCGLGAVGGAVVTVVVAVAC